MAVDTKFGKGGKTTVGDSAGAAGAAPSNASVPGAMNIWDILQNCNAPTLMTEQANEYFNSLVSIISAKTRISIEPLQITTDKVEARVVVSSKSKHAIMLLFGETYTVPPNKLPVTEMLPDVVAKLKALAPDISLVQSIVIMPEDYSRKVQMADFIYSMLLGVDFPDEVNVGLDTLRRSGKFSVSTRIEDVRTEMNRLSPHAIPSRDDIGCVVYLEYNKNPNQLFARPEDTEYRAVLVMSGYTDIKKMDVPVQMANQATGMFNGGASGMGGMTTKFVPWVTMTSIMSAIPSPTILGLAIPVAAEALIVQNGWLRPYQSFAPDAPNLGELVLDDTGKKPYKVTNQQDLSKLLGLCFYTPFFSIDITEGRARIPGIDNFYANPAVAMNAIATVLGEAIPNPQLTIKSTWRDFIGTVTQPGGKVVDTRCLDYLRLIKEIKDFNGLQPLLLQPQKPTERLEDLGRWCTDVKSCYTNYRVTLSSELVSFIASKIAGAVKIEFEGVQASGMININSIVNAGGNSYNQLLTSGAGGTGWSNQNYTGIYGGF